MSEPYEVGRFTYLPGRYVACFHVVLVPYALEKPEMLASLLKVFAGKKISIVHFKLSRPEPGRRVVASIFVDLTGREREEDVLVRELNAGEFIEEVSVIRPLFDGITIDNVFPYLAMMRERVVIFRGIFYEALLKRMRERVGTGYMAILYHAGLEIGRAVCAELMRYAGGDPVRTVVLGQEMFKQVGFGTMKADLNLREHRATVRIWDCFECELFKGSGKPASHLMRGMMAGFLSEIFGEEVHAQETRCIAAGDEYCEFRISRERKIL